MIFLEHPTRLLPEFVREYDMTIYGDIAHFDLPYTYIVLTGLIILLSVKVYVIVLVNVLL